MRRIIRRWSIGMVCGTFFSVGCSSAPPPNPSSAQCRAVPLQTEEAQIFVESTDSPEQREAQRAWCEYLDALHRRAGTSRAMPGLEKCLQARTYAAPKMLRQTARCSQVALDEFDGDPFTREYAAAIARCGAEALDACEAAIADVVPVMATICSSIARCSDSNVTECSTQLEGRLKIHLSRAIGAMNEQGRDVFQNCLQKMTCSDVAGQVVACLEPIMEGLLWLPE